MATTNIAFLRSQKIRQLSRMFIGVGDIISKISPSTGVSIKQSGIAAEYDVTAREYLSICFFISAALSFGTTIIVYIVLQIGEGDMLILAPVFGAVIGLLAYVELISYPKLMVNKRVKDLDRNLLFALRNILVQIRSGVPIFDTFVSISNGNYGQISDEFKNVIERVRSGTSVIDALEELTVRNPSTYFRRAIWQLLNALKSGSDVGDNISTVIKSLSKEQLIEIRQYQSTLNPLAMMYMMIAVIMPSLGITIAIILSTFPGMEAIGNEQTFWGMLGMVIFMQFMFMIIIKSKRPNLMA